MSDPILPQERLWASAAFDIPEADVTDYHVTHLVDQIDGLRNLASEQRPAATLSELNRLKNTIADQVDELTRLRQQVADGWQHPEEVATEINRLKKALCDKVDELDLDRIKFTANAALIGGLVAEIGRLEFVCDQHSNMIKRRIRADVETRLACCRARESAEEFRDMHDAVQEQLEAERRNHVDQLTIEVRGSIAAEVAKQVYHGQPRLPWVDIETVERPDGWLAWATPAGRRTMYGRGPTRALAILDLGDRAARWERLSANPETL